MATAQYLNLRLFLEGQEVPVIGASVISSIGAPAQASIQVVGDSDVLRLAPRTLVHLFVYDPLGKSVLSPDSKDSKYVLLFSGDLMEVQYQKSGSSRNATLVCQDDTSYYDLAYTYFYTQSAISGSQGIQSLTRERAAFVGVKTGRTDAADASLVLGDLLNSVFEDPVPKTFGLKDLKGLLGAVIRIIEQFTGIDDISKGGVNNFFSFHSRRKKLLSQLTMLSDDKIAVKLLSSQFIINFIKRKADQLGDLVTARQLVNYILGFIYYSMVPIPSAMYTKEGIIVKKLPPKSIKPMEAVLDKIIHRVSIGESFGAVGTSSYVTASNKLNSALEVVVGAELDADISLFKELAREEEFTLVLPASESFMELVIAYSVALNAGTALSDLGVITSQLNTYADLIKGTEVLKVVTEEEKTTAGDRLNTTGIIPDLFFGVAPTCNVLYPDMYSSLSYSRSASTEPTRLHLSTGIDRQLFGSDGADNLTYYAPSIDEFKKIQSLSVRSAESSDLNDAKNIVEGILFDHELYTGVIPAFSRVDRIAYTAALAKANREKAKELLDSQLKSAGVGASQGSRSAINANAIAGSFEEEAFNEDERDDFFVRIANYQYIKKRLGSRRASISGILNVNAVAGFPMIVIDGVPVSGAGDLFSIGSDADDHNESYVGLLSSVTHNVSQSASGSTSYELTYVRPHRGKDDEFLSKLTTLERVNTAQDQVRRVNVVATMSILGSESADLLNQSDVDDLLRDLTVAIYCTDNTGASAIIKAASTNAGTISIPKSGSISAGSSIGGSIVSAIEVEDSAQAGLDLDAAGLTYQEQKDLIASKGIGAYLGKLSVVGKLDLDSPTRNRLTRLMTSGFLELSVEDAKALSAASRGGKHRIPIPCFQTIKVYYAGSSEQALPSNPIEETIRPRYIDDNYSSPLIGKAVYKEMLGVTSVIDAVSKDADRYKVDKIPVSVSPGSLGNPSSNKTSFNVVSQESAIDILSYEYASRGRKAEYSFRKVRRPIASIPDVLGKGGFHENAYARSKDDKPLSILQDLVYDRDIKKCPTGYRKATTQEIEDIKKRVNPNLDVREARYKLVNRYVNKLRSKGKLG